MSTADSTRTRPRAVRPTDARNADTVERRERHRRAREAARDAARRDPLGFWGVAGVSWLAGWPALSALGRLAWDWSPAVGLPVALVSPVGFFAALGLVLLWDERVRPAWRRWRHRGEPVIGRCSGCGALLEAPALPRGWRCLCGARVQPSAFRCRPTTSP